MKFLVVHLINALIWSLHTKTDVQSVCLRLYFRNSVQLLQMHHREHPDWVQDCLVWQLLLLRQHSPPESCESSLAVISRPYGTFFCRQCLREAQKILPDRSHPTHRLFSRTCRPSGSCINSIPVTTHLNSCFHCLPHTGHLTGSLRSTLFSTFLLPLAMRF